MKKIVALVLCLVLALSLCTVAMAAGKPVEVTDLEATVTDYDSACKYELEKVITGVAAAETFDVYYLWEIDEDGGKDKFGEYVIAANAKSADIAFVEGSKVVYLNSTDKDYDEVAKDVETVKVADVENCGEMFIADDREVYVVDGTYYYSSKSAGYITLNVGGKLAYATEVTEVEVTLADFESTTTPFTPAAGTLYTVAHDYEYEAKTDDKNTDRKITVTAVTCADCDKSFQFVVGTVKDAIEKFGDGNYTATKYTTINANKTIFVKTGTAAATDSTSTTVESAKTFDAGIALYAGMALASVAGSAVVIGKKKEF